MEVDVNETTPNAQDQARVRPNFRAGEKEKKKENVVFDGKNVIGRLDSLAFKRRSRYLREIYLNPEKRHLYDWTNLEKKILLLDWYHNPSYYEKWKPVETEDMMNRFFSNMIYNFSHLSMTHVGTTPVFVRLLNKFETFRVTYQCIGMIQRYFKQDSTFFDEFKVALICRGGELDPRAEESKRYKPTNPSEYQCIMDGVNFNVFTLTGDEFDKLSPCQECLRSRVGEKTRLVTPKLVFSLPVTAMEMTTTVFDGECNYLLAVRMSNFVRMYNVTSLLNKTVEICKQWDEVRQDYLEKFEKAKRKIDHKFCTGCLLKSEEFERLEKVRHLLRSFSVEKPVELQGLDDGQLKLRTMATRRNTYQTGLKFFYTSFIADKRVVPTFLAAVGAKRACVWDISQVNNTQNKPILSMEFPEGSHPTDISASLGIIYSDDDFKIKNWVVEPKIYSTDDSGYLRLWTFIQGKGIVFTICRSAIKLKD